MEPNWCNSPKSFFNGKNYLNTKTKNSRHYFFITPSLKTGCRNTSHLNNSDKRRFYIWTLDIFLGWLLHHIWTTFCTSQIVGTVEALPGAKICTHITSVLRMLKRSNSVIGGVFGRNQLRSERLQVRPVTC